MLSFFHLFARYVFSEVSTSMYFAVGTAGTASRGNNYGTIVVYFSPRYNCMLVLLLLLLLLNKRLTHLLT